MARYTLNEKQKNLLRILIEGLNKQDGSVRSEWIVVEDRGDIVNIIGIAEELWLKGWQQVTLADLDDFVDCGFLRHKGGKQYTLRTQLIIDAENTNFGEDDVLVHPNIEQASQLMFAPIFGIPPKSSQYLADIFMLMPFHESFRPIYYDHIKPIAQELGRSINRGDDFFSKHSIMTDIWSAIYHSRLVIADCTDKNANVFYELGIAHTIGKPVIMVTQNKADIPFDVRDKRYIQYEYPAGMKLFEQRLKDAIMKVLDDSG